MKVLVAGATGAIGGPLVPQLLAAGHEVAGTTRSEDRAAALRELGAEPVVVDLLDPEAARDAVRRVRPDAIVDQLTSLPEDYDIRRKDLYEANDRIRSVGTGGLLDAAKQAGVRRYVLQSIAFVYAPEGGWVKTEEDRTWDDAPPPFGPSLDVMLGNERKVAGGSELEGLVLRYGFFYGPGTYYAHDGSITTQVRKRRFPIVGRGEGVTSFVHVADAAAATVAALTEGAPGVYNVVDDEPAPLRDWLPEFASAIGAKPPRRVPTWLARLLAGGFASAMASELRGASNAKAKAQLGWTPALPNWREGFRSHLDAHPETPAPSAARR